MCQLSSPPAAELVGATGETRAAFKHARIVPFPGDEGTDLF